MSSLESSGDAAAAVVLADNSSLGITASNPSDVVQLSSGEDVPSPGQNEGQDAANNRPALFGREPLVTCETRVSSVRHKDIPQVLQRVSEMFECSGATDSPSDNESMNGLPRDPDRSAIVYDVDALRAGFSSVCRAFPAHWKHCLAIKACPLAFVIEEARDGQLGIEAASYMEMYIALSHNPEGLVVFDSPAKTSEELEVALRRGALINANSLEELDRIDTILQRQAAASETITSTPPARVGIRLNPLVGAGAISELSVSVPTSKFGVPATPNNVRKVFDAFRRWPWVVGLHVHVGSQGFSLQQLAKGVARVCEIADAVDEELGRGRVSVMDIGGGLPANYDSDTFSPTFAEYAAVLRGAAPSLFDNTERTVVTEFGRSLVAKAALTVSTIEYVRSNIIDAEPQAKDASGSADVQDAGSTGAADGGNAGESSSSPEYQTLVTHVGADIFLRSSYCPGKFSHRLSMFGPHGEPLAGPLIKTDVAGPLCFQGDYVARGWSLPRATPGDLIVVHDSGANTLSLFSRHCSRRAPAVYGYMRDGDGHLIVRVVKEKETAQDVARFWGAR